MDRGNPRSRGPVPARLTGTLLLAACLGVLGSPWLQPPARARAQTPVSTQGPTIAPVASQSPAAVQPSVAPTSPEGAGATGSASPEAPASPLAPAASAAPADRSVPSATPTQPPIIVDPPAAGVMPGSSERLRVMQVLGTIVVTVANPAIADASIDQVSRTLTIVGKTVGSTIVTVRDDRGLSRDVPVRVADPAGSIADNVFLRVTGRPASPTFLREQAMSAALAGVHARAGANVLSSTDTIAVAAPLRVDDIVTLDVPLIVSGDRYFTVQGTTHVRVENFAQPAIRPQSLLVSDFPETLKENGILFTADLSPKLSERFLYYHFNPANQPDRRIVLKVQNPSSQPALVQFIAGIAGPDANEMQVGHLSTQRFLVRLAQNEGTVVTVPGNATISLLAQGLPARSVVSGLMQLHEIAGAPLHLTLIAQDAADPVDGPVPSSALLVGDRPHARGIYDIPEFFFTYRYDAIGPDLEIPIGQIPLPNIVVGQTLAGDYGVLQSVTVDIVNDDRRNARQIAIYANPRGGKATGTFVIDRVLVRAHAMQPFGHYKLRQYTIPPGSHVRTEIVTMPEGGSSYPLRLIVAPDDGSAPPGSPESPIY
jgi:hypothetical protein